MKIKSVMVTIEEEEKPDSNHMMPIDVFIYLKEKAFEEKNMGMYTEEQVQKLRDWRPS